MQTPLKIKLSFFMFLQYFTWGSWYVSMGTYVDDAANERIRGACQGFIAFILWGVGALVGTLLAGKVLAMHTLPVPVGTIQHHWRDIWLMPALGAAVVLIVFLLFFREPPKKTPARVILGRNEENR